MFKTVFKNVLKVIAIILAVWFVISFAEILMKNLSIHPKYWGGNLIINFLNWLSSFTI